MSAESRQQQVADTIRALRREGMSRDGMLEALCERGLSEDEADLALDGHPLPERTEQEESRGSAARGEGGAPWPVPPSLDPGPSGIGGWLIVFLIGLVLSTAALLTNGQEGLVLLRSEDMPVIEQQVPGITRLVTIEVALNLAIAVATFGAGIALVRKKRFAPRLVIGLLLIRGVFLVGDAVVAASVLGETLDVRGVLAAAMGTFIWVLYFQQSVRVRNTFVY